MPVEQTVDQACLSAAGKTLRSAFEDKKALPTLFSDLEAELGIRRDEWGAHLLRRLADTILKEPEKRVLTPEHESRWFNLIGFLLRPGFGAAGDDARIAHVWKLWHSGPAFGRKPQVANEWWILWRRVAGGLREGHQLQIAGHLFKSVTGEGGVPILQATGGDGQVLREQWRCLAALERIPVKRKIALLKKLRGQPAPEDHYFWVIARLGARHLLHGPENCVVSADHIEPIGHYLLDLPTPEIPHAQRLLGLAISSICKRCGIRNLEVSEALRQAASDRLTAMDMPDLADALFLVGTRDRQQEEALLGDELPFGLEITASS